ncbi:restriction endonuclease subunit M [Brachyspira aalborgi]|uniref:Eco57I restriction-modification methylase domain-containing protein n=1 Tax=Brachyspira aalborgi TaxID=29522 RepID=UPI0011CC36F7|nr:N-6 DNA methylase [Brachyspira aalborgi]TXJ14934.1 restriction endonuclease subunit M [Brachyspira aalborgi]TXJ18430.1 restriction endonuclease subunit M [Brachyspira aalborgi]TXJ48364.1 restriction endonuclease subunit M [Brachyspira aalborgi]
MSYKDKLVSDINSLIKDFKELNTYKKSEEHIQSLFTLKLLELLGWNSKTIIVNTGQEIKTGKRPDIILNKDGNTLLVIESKDASRYDMLDGFYKKDKSKISFVEQLCNYCDAEGIYWGILTNFVEWRLYSVFQKRLYKNEKYAFSSLLWNNADKSSYIDLLSDKGINFLINLKSSKIIESRGRFDTDPIYYPEQIEIKDKFFSNLKKWRLSIRNTIRKNLPKYNDSKIDLITQKILDRLIFVGYCSDNKVISQNKLHAILHSKIDLYKELQKIFYQMDDKFDSDLFSKSEEDEYNKILISDNILRPIIEELSNIDFSKLSIHIMGEVYENYLEEILRQNDKILKNKKKLQGIYYTTEYVIKYIIKNTLTPILSKCKTASELDNIKVLDSSCGSGSFLILAFDEFIEQYKRIENQPLFEFERRKLILQNNLYGVDIDEKAVEITKLNLLVKCLENGASLDLSGKKILPNIKLNIRCGNSLVSSNLSTDSFDLFSNQHVDTINKLLELHKLFKYSNDDNKYSIYKDIEIEEFKLNSILNKDLEYKYNLSDIKPFNYHIAFPEVFKDGGFDCVIGNPPWGANIDSILDYLNEYYPNSTVGFKDTYKCFFDKSIQLLKPKGKLGYITPNSFYFNPLFRDLRKLLNSYYIDSMINLGERVFENVEAPSAITIITKSNIQNKKINTMDLSFSKSNKEKENLINNGKYSIINQNIFNKTQNNIFTFNLRDLKSNEVYFEQFANIKDAGIQYHRFGIGMKNRGGNDLHDRLFSKNKNEFKNSVACYYGKLINRYFINDFTDKYFNMDYKSVLKSNEQVSFTKEYQGKRNKIVWRQTSDNIKAAIDKKGIWFRNTIQCCEIKKEYSNYKLEYLLAILNSKYLNYIYNNNIKESNRVFPQIKISNLEKLPIRIIDFNNKLDIDIYNKIISIVEELSKFEFNSIAYKSYISILDDLIFDLYSVNKIERDKINLSYKN